MSALSCSPLLIATILDDSLLSDAHAIFFFFNDTATTEIYTLSLHDALPIYRVARMRDPGFKARLPWPRPASSASRDRKSTRLNSSHSQISYAVFCLKKKKRMRNSKTNLTITLNVF